MAVEQESQMMIRELNVTWRCSMKCQKDRGQGDECNLLAEPNRKLFTLLLYLMSIILHISWLVNKHILQS
jgi:hypothetical protein